MAWCQTFLGIPLCLSCDRSTSNKPGEQCVAQEHRDHYFNHAVKYQRDERRKNKRLVIDAYGGKCACCGEGNLAFLTISHDFNDGGTHRRELLGQTGKPSGGNPFYVKLMQLGYPRDRGLIVECYNCNCGRRFTGTCPHKKLKE